MTLNEQLDEVYGAKPKPNHLEADEYQRLCSRTFNIELNKQEQMMHALHGLASEIGEIHSLYQKVYQGHKLDNHRVISELGDALWFASELADSLGYRLSEVMEYNIDKLKARYPQGFSAERSLHRKEGDL